MTAHITIAIPTYNRAELLKRALDSACAQTSSAIEILVSDNGSTDGTAALLASYHDPRLRKIRHEMTVSRAQHGVFLFHNVQTELLLILSDDDYIEPEFAAEILQLFDEHPEISFAYTGCIEHYDDAALPALVGPRIESSLDFFAAHYAGERHVSWCACVTRVQDILACGPQPEDRIIGDMFFWTKIGFKGPVGCVGRPLSHYSVLRPTGDNESRAVPILAWGNEVKLLAQEVLSHAEKAGAGRQYQNKLKENMKHYISRSVANQFIWSRISGGSRMACLALVIPCLRFEGWSLNTLSRVVASLILSRKMLRRIVVSAAAKMALQRSHKSI